MELAIKIAMTMALVTSGDCDCLPGCVCDGTKGGLCDCREIANRWAVVQVEGRGWLVIARADGEYATREEAQAEADRRGGGDERLPISTRKSASKTKNCHCSERCQCGCNETGECVCASGVARGSAANGSGGTFAAGGSRTVYSAPQATTQWVTTATSGGVRTLSVAPANSYRPSSVQPARPRPVSQNNYRAPQPAYVAPRQQPDHARVLGQLLTLRATADAEGNC